MEKGVELQSFIAETLKEILDGVIEAQEYAKSVGANITPIYTRASPEHFKISTTSFDTAVQMVHFDIAIVTSSKDEAQGKIGILVAGIGAGVHGKTTGENSNTSRIVFDIPVVFPKPKP